MQIVKCKECGAEIFWVAMRETGKNMPLNKRPSYGVMVNEDTGFKVKIYTPHFGKCTNRKALEGEYNKEVKDGSMV